MRSEWDDGIGGRGGGLPRVAGRGRAEPEAPLLAALRAAERAGDTQRAAEYRALLARRAQERADAARSASPGWAAHGVATRVGTAGLGLMGGGALLAQTGCGCIIGLPIGVLGVVLVVLAVIGGLAAAGVVALLGALGLGAAGARRLAKGRARSSSLSATGLGEPPDKRRHT